MYIVQILVDNFGYEVAMIIKNLTIFLSGGVIFSILTLVSASYVAKNVSRDLKLDGAILVRVKTKDKVIYRANPTSIWSIVVIYFVFFYWKICDKGTIVVEDNALHKTVATGALFLGVIIISLGVYLSINIIVYDPNHDAVLPVSKLQNIK